MPTTRGWFTVALGVGLWVAGGVFGAGALEQIGFALIVLVVVAAVIVRSRRHDLVICRTVAPERARRGQRVEVKISLTNNGRGAAPLMLLDDRVPLELAGHARFALNGVEPGGTRETSYEIRPPRRGRYAIGPLHISFVDPFGLAQRRSMVAESTDLLVHPSVEPLIVPRELGQQRSMSVSAIKQLTGARGEDFYTLREYAEGDDLRKIHWPSTAKVGKTMIRQEETPWHTRATLLLDDHRARNDAVGDSSSFERCVEAAASLSDLYHRSGYTYRLLCAHNPGLPHARGRDHFNRCLDLLAVIDSRSTGPGDELLVRLAELERGSSAEGTLVVVSPGLGPEAAVALTRCQRRFRTVMAVLFPAHRFGSTTTRNRWEGEKTTHDATSLLGRSGIRAIVLGPGDSLGAAWGSLSPSRAMGGEGHWALRPERV
jgi:uncharacterized protein (DUF58 family)